MWDSEMFGGVPFLGRLGAQGMYFPHLPFSILSPNQALDLLVPVHLMLLAGGMYVLARVGMRLAPPSGFVAGSIAVGSAYVAVKMLSYDQLVAIAWIPWILLSCELAFRNPRQARYAAPLALSLTCLILGGHPQFIYFAFFLVALYVCARLIDLKSVKSVPLLFSGLVLAGLSSSLQLAAAWFLGKSSAVPSQRALSVLSQPNYVLDTGKIVSGLLIDPFSKLPTSATGTGEAILGIGVVGACVAVAGAIGGGNTHRATRLLLVIAGFAGVLLAVGPQWLPFRIAYRIVPGFGAARVPGRWLIISLFAVCILAAHGTTILCEKGTAVLRTKNDTMRRSLPLILVLIVGVAALVQGPRLSLFLWWIAAAVLVTMTLMLRKAGKLFTTAKTLVLIALVIEVVVPLAHLPARKQQFVGSFDNVRAPLVGKIKAEGGRVFAQTFDNFDNFDYLVRHLRPNTQKLYGVGTIDGYDGGQWIQRRWVQTMRSVSQNKINTDLTLRSQPTFPLQAVLFAQLGVRWLLMDTSVVPAEALSQGWNGPRGRYGPVELWENPEWLGSGVLYFQSRKAVLSTDKELAKLPADVVLVEDDRQLLACDAKVKSECGRVAAIEISRSAGSGRYSTHAARQGILRIDEAWSRDWRASIDGKAARTIPVNGNSLGIEVPAGSHKIHFWYSPRWAGPLLVVSLLSLTLVLIANISLVSTLRRARSKRGALE
jgi:hypothetical protein